jgi:hypothetical protein
MPPKRQTKRQTEDIDSAEFCPLGCVGKNGKPLLKHPPWKCKNRLAMLRKSKNEEELFSIFSYQPPNYLETAAELADQEKGSRQFPISVDSTPIRLDTSRIDTIDPNLTVGPLKPMVEKEGQDNNLTDDDFIGENLEDPVDEDTIGNPTVEDLIVGDPIIENPIVEDLIVEDPIVEGPIVDDSISGPAEDLIENPTEDPVPGQLEGILHVSQTNPL